MKKTRLEKLFQVFSNLNKVGLKTSFGIYIDDMELIMIDKELFQDGIFFTRRQIVDAFKNNSQLFIKETNTEGILEVELINQNIFFQRNSKDMILIKMYKNELIELYELSKRIRLQNLEQARNISIPH